MEQALIWCAPWLKAMCWNDRAVTLEHDPQAQHWMKHINENKRFHFLKTALEQGSCHTHPEPEHHVRWRQHCGFSPPRLFRELEQHGPSLWHTSSHGQTQLLPSSWPPSIWAYLKSLYMAVQLFLPPYLGMTLTKASHFYYQISQPSL